MNTSSTTMMAILLIATSVVRIGGLAVIPTTTLNAYANHTDNPLPNPSEEGEDHGNVGLFDHGCDVGNRGPDPNGPGVNGYQQGGTNSGGECRRQGLAE
jgi:hypothetical protein